MELKEEEEEEEPIYAEIEEPDPSEEEKKEEEEEMKTNEPLEKLKKNTQKDPLIEAPEDIFGNPVEEDW